MTDFDKEETDKTRNVYKRARLKKKKSGLKYAIS